MRLNKYLVVGLDLEDVDFYLKEVKLNGEIQTASLASVSALQMHPRTQIILTHKALIYGDLDKIENLKVMFKRKRELAIRTWKREMAQK